MDSATPVSNDPEKYGAPDRIDSDRLRAIFTLKGAFGV